VITPNPAPEAIVSSLFVTPRSRARTPLAQDPSQHRPSLAHHAASTSSSLPPLPKEEARSRTSPASHIGFASSSAHHQR